MNSSTTSLRIARSHTNTATLSLMSASAGAMLAGASFMTMALSQTADSVLLFQTFVFCFICGLFFAGASVIGSGLATRQINQRIIHLAALSLGLFTLLSYLVVLLRVLTKF